MVTTKRRSVPLRHACRRGLRQSPCAVMSGGGGSSPPAAAEWLSPLRNVRKMHCDMLRECDSSSAAVAATELRGSHAPAAATLQHTTTPDTARSIATISENARGDGSDADSVSSSGEEENSECGSGEEDDDAEDSSSKGASGDDDDE